MDKGIKIVFKKMNLFKKLAKINCKWLTSRGIIVDRLKKSPNEE